MYTKLSLANCKIKRRLKQLGSKTIHSKSSENNIYGQRTIIIKTEGQKHLVIRLLYLLSV